MRIPTSSPTSPTLRRPHGVHGRIVVDAVPTRTRDGGCQDSSQLETSRRVAGCFTSRDRASQALQPLRNLCDAVVQNLKAESLKHYANSASPADLIAIANEAEKLPAPLRQDVSSRIALQAGRVARAVPEEPDAPEYTVRTSILFIKKMTVAIQHLKSSKKFAESWRNLLTIVTFLPAEHRRESLIALIDLIARLQGSQVCANGFHDAATHVIALPIEDQPMAVEKLIPAIALLFDENAKIKAIEQVLLLLRGAIQADISKPLNQLVDTVLKLQSSRAMTEGINEIGKLAEMLPTKGRMAFTKTVAENLPELSNKAALRFGIEFLANEIRQADPRIQHITWQLVEIALSKIGNEIEHDIVTNRHPDIQLRRFKELTGIIDILPIKLQHKTLSIQKGITMMAAANQSCYATHLNDCIEPSCKSSLK